MDRARPPHAPTPRRRDAVETRERILRVAIEGFAGRSGPLSFDEIAGRAGVSRATVYRHFPHRHALGAAVAERGIGALRRALAKGERIAFRDLLHAVLATVASLRWLVDQIDELPERQRHRQRRMLVDVLTPAFRRAQADGELRRDVDPTDLDPILRALHAATREPGGEVAARRLVAVLIDGLFVHRSSDPAAGIDAVRPTCAWTEATRR